MSMRFNPRTGEWEEVEFRTEPEVNIKGVGLIGYWLSAYWDDKRDNFSWILTFVPMVFITLWQPLIGILLWFLIVFEKCRAIITVTAYFLMLPVIFLLRYIFYNGWTLATAIFLAIGILL